MLDLKKYYYVNHTCQNCRASSVWEIPRGETIVSFVNRHDGCKNCGIPTVIEGESRELKE